MKIKVIHIIETRVLKPNCSIVLKYVELYNSGPRVSMVSKPHNVLHAYD